MDPCYHNSKQLTRNEAAFKAMPHICLRKHNKKANKYRQQNSDLNCPFTLTHCDGVCQFTPQAAARMELVRAIGLRIHEKKTKNTSRYLSGRTVTISYNESTIKKKVNKTMFYKSNRALCSNFLLLRQKHNKTNGYMPPTPFIVYHAQLEG